MYRRRKKASLSLSVNAIVILVLAITMLGLGLAFTKGMFAKLKGKLEIPPPNIPATEDEPIVLPADEVKITATKEFAFSINIYNYYGGAQYLVPRVECNLAQPAQLAGAQLVDPDTFVSFKIVIPANSLTAAPTTLTPGSKTVCAIYVCADATGPPTDCTSGSDKLYDQKQIVIDLQ